MGKEKNLLLGFNEFNESLDPNTCEDTWIHSGILMNHGSDEETSSLFD